MPSVCVAIAVRALANIFHTRRSSVVARQRHIALSMERCAFLTVTDWPASELSEVGRLTESFTNEAEDHIGIFVPFCTDAEVAAHSNPRISNATANGEKHVSFDFMSDLLPRFQSIRNKDYYTARSRTLFYPVLNVDAADVHDVCIEVAQARPQNYCCHRLNSVFWCWPFPCCCCPAQRIVAQSTCVALSARIVAAAATGNVPKALANDGFVFRSLLLNRFSLSTPRAPYFLSGYTPRGAAIAMLNAGVIGPPVDSVDRAMAICANLKRDKPTGKALLLRERPLPLVSLKITSVG